MPTIVKATLTVTSSYAAASASSVFDESWGQITLWDIRPWLPWGSRSVIGATGWQGYLGRAGVMQSQLAPGYDSTNQGPKSWAKRTDSVVIYDSTVTPHPAAYPYTSVSIVGTGPYSYSGGVAASGDAAFDASTLQDFVDTLIVAAYAYNSVPPSFGGPTATDNLNIYGLYVDVEFDTGATTRFHPTGTVTVAPGAGVGNPTTVQNPDNAVDSDITTTFAAVQETNGRNGILGALWNPAVLLIAGWSWGAITCDDPPRGRVTVPYTHTFPVSGGTGPYTYAITAGSLPNGLTLDTSTGVVSGTPTLAGTFVFTISVTEASGIPASVSCSITIIGILHEWLDLWVWRQLFAVETVDDVLEFPPGYERALTLQLAAEMGHQYPGHDLSKVKAKLAAAVAHIDRENVSNSQAIEELPE